MTLAGGSIASLSGAIIVAAYMTTDTVLSDTLPTIGAVHSGMHKSFDAADPTLGVLLLGVLGSCASQLRILAYLFDGTTHLVVVGFPVSLACDTALCCLFRTLDVPYADRRESTSLREIETNIG